MDLTKCPDQEGKTIRYGFDHNCGWHYPSDCQLCRDCWDFADKEFDIFMKKYLDNIGEEK